MRVRFSDDNLDRLETDANYRGGHGQPVIRAYRRVMNFLRNCVDERDIRAMHSLRFEKLKGNRSHQMSLRLNDQWRLIVEIEPAEPKNVIVVIGIEDYH